MCIVCLKSKFWGTRFWPIFFFKIEACGVSRAMPCDARSFCNLFKRKGPTQRLKTAKKSILRPLWTPYPNFWYLIFGQFVFSSKYGHVGRPEQCHVMPGPYATFSNAREPTQRLKTAKKSILWPFWTQNPNFSAVLSC